MIYVVVLNWNGAAHTLLCVASVLRMVGPPPAIVVCDNDSHDDDVRTLRDGLNALIPDRALREHRLAPGMADTPIQLAPGEVALIHTGANLGFAGGVNVGMRVALADPTMTHCWVLNNDTEVAPHTLSALLERVRAEPRIGICGSTLLYHDQPDKVQALGGAAYLPWRARSVALGAFSSAANLPRDPKDVESQMAYVIGAAMLVSREFLEAVGMMDERYFLYSEEHDWAHRGKQIGFRLGWAPDAIVFHKHGATIGTKPSGGSPLSLFYLFRSRAMFSARHYPRRTPLALAWMVWDAVKYMLKGHPAKTVAALRGLLAWPFGWRF